MNLILNLYKKLRKKHGHPKGQWSLWCKRPKIESEREEVIIGAILTQNTNWKNVERAMENLKRVQYCGLRKISELGKKNPARLKQFIHSSGFYRSKSKYLIEIADFVMGHGGLQKLRKWPILKLRQALLGLKGIGPETADSILLYALDKPIFVIDEYTRRLMKKMRLARNLSYESLQKLFEKNLARNFRLYQDFHALIVIEGKIGGQEGT